MPMGSAAARVPKPTPAAKGRVDPTKDPRFTKLVDDLQKSAAKVKQHPSAAKKAAEAQAAAQPPASEKLAGAKANQVDAMKSAETGKPEPSSFLAVLRAEIEKVMPKTLDDADKFMEGGKKEELKGAVSGNAKQQTAEASGGLKSASGAPPDPSAVPGKPVTALPADPAVAPAPVDASNAVPAPKPASEVSLQENKQAADQQLKDAEVTPEQLQKANDPRFSKVITAKGAVAQHADTAPDKYRAGEQKVLGEGAAKAQGDTKAGLAKLGAVRTESGTKVRSGQLSAKQKDEARRKEVVDNIEKIYSETKRTVEGKLASLETDVNAQFDAGMTDALENMKSSTRAEIERFKDERYSGITGAGRWIADLFRPVPPEIKAITERGRQRFTQQMDALVVRIAAFVETRLQEAKNEVAKGQNKIKTYVSSLPRDLQAVGRAAEQEMASRFDELRQGIDDKKNELAQKLAEKYKEAHDKADEELKKIQDENKGLLAGLAESLGEVLKALLEFKAKLMALFRKGEDAIKLVIADPIGFLANLFAAVKLGFTQFVGNIWNHLKTGFMGWLFGALGDAGITMPTDLSLGSILKLVLEVLGLTWPRIRAEGVKLIGERNVALIEKLVEFLMKIFNAGPAAAWEELKAYLADLKAQVIDAIQNWVVTTVIKAAITKLISMFNPVGAIVQAVMAIYNTVMFLIERIGQIMAFVEAIVNSVTAIAQGAIGGAANWIEQALGRTIPLVISLLARLLGLGGISQKIKEIITKVQNAVWGAIRKVVAKVVGFVKKLFGRGSSRDDDPQHAAKVEKGLAQLNTLSKAAIKDGLIERPAAERIAATVKGQHPVFKSLTVVAGGDTWDYDYVASPGAKVPAGRRGAWPPPQRYLPPNFDVRNKLYINGSGFGSAKIGVKKNALEQLRTKIENIREAGRSEASKQGIWTRLVEKGLVPSGAERDAYTIRKVNAASYNVDHEKPLAKHWMANGFNCSDEPRQTIAGESNLRLLLESVNKSIQAGGAHYTDKFYVGASFSSEYNHSPSDADKIDGKAFRDKDGNELKRS